MSKKNLRKYQRSGNKTCPICGFQGKLVEHHIHGKDFKRSEELWNRCEICNNCHAKIHEGEIIIEKKQQGLLIWHYWNEPSLTGQDAKPPLY